MTDKTLSERVAELERELSNTRLHADTMRRKAERLERTLEARNSRCDELDAAANKMFDDIRAAERTLAEVTSARDSWKKSSAEWMQLYATEQTKRLAFETVADQGVKEVERLQGLLATAERRATEAARENALLVAKDAAQRVCLDWMRVDGNKYPRDWRGTNAYAEESVAKLYPAVPTEREGAGKCGCTDKHEVCDVCQGVARPTPPVEGAVAGDSAHVPPTWFCECGHQRYDHSFDSHGRLLCVANGGRCECKSFRPTPPQAAPERIAYVDKDGYIDIPVTQEVDAYVRISAKDCQRIVETGRRASGRDDA